MPSKFSTKKISWKNVALVIVALSLLSASIYSRVTTSNYGLDGGINTNDSSVKITGNSNTYPFRDSNISTSTDKAYPNYSKDTDSDGLYDWEEVLWGTNINKKDTDGDGVNDGEEAKSNRDPLVKGVGDKTQESASGTAKNTKVLNNTDKFGRELFSRYIELKQAGESDTPEGKDKIVQAMLQSGSLVETPKQDTLKSLILLGDSSSLPESQIKEYGNSVGKVFANYSIKSRNENFIIRDYLANTDETAFAELGRIITSYKNIRAGLLKVPVPSDIAQNHLDLINSINELIFIVEAYKKVETDPIATLQAVGMYQNTSDSFKNTLSSIRDYFLSHSITYNSTEYGKIFNQPGI